MAAEQLGDWTVVAFTDVTNTKEVLDAFETGKLGPCCIVAGSMVLSRLQLAAAMQRLSQHNNLRTKNIHSELLLMLSPSKNIETALKNFSCKDEDKSFVVAIHKAADAKAAVSTISAAVKGTPLSLGSLKASSDAEKLVKVYSLPTAEVDSAGLESAVVNRIATADI